MNSGKDQNTNIKWSIITKAETYNNGLSNREALHHKS